MIRLNTPRLICLPSRARSPAAQFAFLDTEINIMTIDEYKALYPIDAVFIQVDDIERTMTPEEYDAWCAECVEYINNDPLAQ